MRVICPNCRKSVVVDKTETAVCPHCGNEFNVEEGRQLIYRTHQYLSTLAYRELNQLGDYEKAAQYFDQLVGITPNDLPSVIGRCLSYLYKATFFETNYKKVIGFFDECDITLDSENSLTLLSFFEDALNQVQIYLDVTKIRLFEDGKLISGEYRNPYYEGLAELKEFLNFLKETLSIVKDEEKELYSDSKFEERIDNYLKEVEERSNLEFVLVENPHSLENNNICEMKKKVEINDKKLIIACVVMLLLAVVFVILGVTIKKNYFYYISIAPFVIGVGIFALYMYLTKRKN